MKLGATQVAQHIGASCVPAVTYWGTETFPFANEPTCQTTLPTGSGNQPVAMVTPQSQAIADTGAYTDKVLRYFFF